VSEQPVVSIVIVTFRARDHVLRCLASLREHTGLAYEAIVVDDASGDGTVEAVRERFPEARVVAQPVNRGLPAGRNAALPLTRGDYVLMLDSDTELKPGAVAAMKELLDARPDVGIVSPKLLFADGNVQPSCRRWPAFSIPFLRRGPYAKLNPDPEAHRRHMMSDFGFDRQRPVVSTMGAAQMWRADLPQLIGPYDERISSYGGEDTDWCLRAWAAGLEVVYLPEAVVVHHWQHVVRRNPWSRHSLRALRDFYYLQWKHRALRRSPRLAEARA
jgi:N-acetylglucosaminyl-diphospho-decaprenol L-rhamnosyltransferase